MSSGAQGVVIDRYLSVGRHDGLGRVAVALWTCERAQRPPGKRRTSVMAY
jgi:hypothetical protein